MIITFVFIINILKAASSMLCSPPHHHNRVKGQVKANRGAPTSLLVTSGKDKSPRAVNETNTGTREV